jgi:hypothetical protein
MMRRRDDDLNGVLVTLFDTGGVTGASVGDDGVNESSSRATCTEGGACADGVLTATMLCFPESTWRSASSRPSLANSRTTPSAGVGSATAWTRWGIECQHRRSAAVLVA